LDVRLTTCCKKSIVTKSKEAMAGLSETRRLRKRFKDLRIGSWNVLSLPKLRWEDVVMEDAGKLGERNWRNAARSRDGWQKLLKKALAQKELLCK
jgi:hypothetical protein